MARNEYILMRNLAVFDSALYSIKNGLMIEILKKLGLHTVYDYDSNYHRYIISLADENDNIESCTGVLNGPYYIIDKTQDISELVTNVANDIIIYYNETFNLE